MRPRVLVIDDDSSMRKFMSEGLRMAGYTVEEADGPMTGLDMCEQTEYEVVVTDIIMPGRDGTSLIVELTRRFPEIKLVAVSGAQPTQFLDHLEMARKVGAHHTLRKPFTVEQLSSCVRRLAFDKGGAS